MSLNKEGWVEGYGWSEGVGWMNKKYRVSSFIVLLSTKPPRSRTTTLCTSIFLFVRAPKSSNKYPKQRQIFKFDWESLPHSLPSPLAAIIFIRTLIFVENFSKLLLQNRIPHYPPSSSGRYESDQDVDDDKDDSAVV